jgi:membrane protein
VAAYLPSLLSGIARRGDTPGWSYQLALELLTQLQRARGQDADLSSPGQRRGLSLEALAQALRVDGLQLEEPLRALRQLDWVGCLEEEEARWVLLVDPWATPLAPLVNSLLLRRALHTQAMWDASGWDGLSLGQALDARQSAAHAAS